MIQQPASTFMFPASATSDEAVALIARLPAADAPERGILPEHLALGAIWLATVLLGVWRLLH